MPSGDVAAMSEDCPVHANAFCTYGFACAGNPWLNQSSEVAAWVLIEIDNVGNTTVD